MKIKIFFIILFFAVCIFSVNAMESDNFIDEEALKGNCCFGCFSYCIEFLSHIFQAKTDVGILGEPVDFFDALPLYVSLQIIEEACLSCKTLESALKELSKFFILCKRSNQIAKSQILLKQIFEHFLINDKNEKSIFATYSFARNSFNFEKLVPLLVWSGFIGCERGARYILNNFLEKGAKIESELFINMVCNYSNGLNYRK